jgi:glycosyltransferase involved in cell wall biosynthesis
VSRPEVSVVIPTYNRAAMLQGCIRSMFAQDFAKELYEIIVADDGSTDSTKQVVQTFRDDSEGPSLCYVRCDHGGPNAARNAGVRLAKADLICFVDDDVDAPSGWLRALVAGVDQNPSAGCIGGPIRLRLEGKPPRLCGREALGETELDLGDMAQKTKFVWSANMLVTRSALELVGAFNDQLPIYADEIEWEERLRRSGGEVVYIPEAWLWHRRAAHDLRLLRLLRLRFIRGRNRATYFSVTGQSVSAFEELNLAARALGHAIIRGCSGGVMRASSHIGLAWGATRLRGRTSARGSIDVGVKSSASARLEKM